MNFMSNIPYGAKIIAWGRKAPARRIMHPNCAQRFVQIMPETFRDDNTTNMTQSIMKYAQVIQAQTLGPPSSPPNTSRLSTKTEIHPTEVEKKTSNEKLSPFAFSICKGSPYAIKL